MGTSRSAALALCCFLLVCLWRIVSSEASVLDVSEASLTARGASPRAGSPTGCAPPEDGSYDYYILALQWPPGAVTTREDRQDQWTIHGLWPSRSLTPQTYPCACRQNPFQLRSVEGMLADMRRYWPTLYPKPKSALDREDGRFWAHEWEKHGTCIRGWDQTKYFSETLRVRRVINPNAVLSRANIFPSLQPVQKVSIEQAFKREFKVSPTLGCKKTSIPGLRATQQLSEIGICLSFRMQVIPCPVALYTVESEINNCNNGSSVIYLPPSSPK